jgi:splicing factor, arginine/serine-rich 3
MASDRGRKLYVGGLLDTVHKEDVTREFKKFGNLADVWVARNPPGFAFVEFTSSVDAEKAVRALDGMNVCGSRIRFEYANPGSGNKPDNRGPKGNQTGGRSTSARDRSPAYRGRPKQTSPFNNTGVTNYGRRGRSPPSTSRLPSGLDQLSAALLTAGQTGQAGFPWAAAYPMMPFLQPEDLLRQLRARGSSPANPAGRSYGASSSQRRPRSRSPVYQHRDNKMYGGNRGRSPQRSNRFASQIMDRGGRGNSPMGHIGRRSSRDRSNGRNGARR